MRSARPAVRAFRRVQCCAALHSSRQLNGRCFGSVAAESDFHDIADGTIERIENAIDILDDHLDNFEIDYADGVLNVVLGDAGQWVINKQTPNRQIWWSSPISGPKRFEYMEDSEPALWICTRNSEEELFALLQQEVEQVTGIAIECDES